MNFLIRTPLQKLKLNDIEGVNDIEILKAIGKHPILQYLELRDIGLGSATTFTYLVDKIGSSCLMESCSENNSLKYIDLMGNFNNEEHTDIIADWLDYFTMIVIVRNFFQILI